MPRALMSSSLRARTCTMYSRRATKKLRSFAPFSCASAAAVQARIRCTIFSDVFGDWSCRSVSTARMVSGQSGANGSFFSPFSLAIMSTPANAFAGRSSMQSSPSLSSSSLPSSASSAASSASLFSASSSSPSSSSSSPPASSSSSPSSSSSSASEPSRAPFPAACLGRASFASSLTSRLSASEPSARTRRARSNASSFSACSLAISSGVFNLSVAIAFLSIASSRTRRS
mmetsp:Transcript_58807/g.165927  ORF Transcript_58807/g.165927 Transcript_58807/m.165927 type:complete len:230 (+) Transcript_58807:1174-1863(+)